MPIKWRPDFSFGNMVTIVSMIFAAGMAWSTVQARDTEHDRRLSQLEVDLGAEKLRNTEILQSLARVETDVSYLRQAMTEGR